MSNEGFEGGGVRAGSAVGWAFYGQGTTRERLAFAGIETADPVASPNTFDVSDWTAFDSSVTAGSSSAPGGTTAAQKIVDTIDAAEHAVLTTADRTLQTNKAYSFGAYLKAETLAYAGVVIASEGSTRASAVVDLSGPQIVTLFESAGLFVAAEVDVTAVGAGWFRVCLSVAVEASVAVRFGVVLSLDGTSTVYAGDGSGAVSAWGAFATVGDLDAIESFDRGWSTEGSLSEITFENSEIAEFDTDFASPTLRETFESAWSNRPIFSSLGLRESAVFDAETPSTTEDFSQEWPGFDPFGSHIIDLVPAIFVGGGEVEDFEAGWRSNENVAATIASSAAAQFDGANAEAVEDFEEVLLDRQVSADPATNKFESAAHGLTTTNVVYYVSVGGAYPGGVFRTIPYWVVNPTTDDFQLSKSYLGAAIDVTSEGEGEHLVRGDPSRYWNTPNYNPTP